MNWYRNTIKILIVLSLTMLIESCNEIIDSFDGVAADRIIVTSAVTETKAGYEGTTVLPSKFIMDIDQNDPSYNYSLVTMAKVDGNTYREQGNTTLNWASTDHSNVKIKALTIPYGLNKTDLSNVMTINICEDQRTEENVKNSDLLGAKIGDGVVINGNEIKINFKHLMSKFYVSYSIKNSVYNSAIQVNSITLENTCIKGGYSYASMDYDSSISKGFGSIQMYHNSSNHTAEAIFFPYIQTENATLVVNVTINGTNKDLKCPILLNDPQGYIGGNRYKITVEIDGNSIKTVSVNEIKDWVEDNSIMDNYNDKKILWIGTSIPKGEGENNYPRMVAEVLGCTVINNSQGGSRVTMTETPVWTNLEDFENNYKYTQGYCLSGTVSEIDAKYRPILQELKHKDGTAISNSKVEAWLNLFKDNSFENILLPYIQGTDACNVIVFDHGYNDHNNIVREGLKYPNADGSLPNGLDWYNSIAYGEQIYVDTYNFGKYSFIGAMSFIIRECRKINPNIKIIIGNYFATKSPSIAWEHPNEGGVNCTELILSANKAISTIWNLDIVNVYKYTGLDNEWVFDDFKKFCDDYVHPSANGNVESNKVIADAYVKELRRIFSGN